MRIYAYLATIVQMSAILIASPCGVLRIKPGPWFLNSYEKFLYTKVILHNYWLIYTFRFKNIHQSGIMQHHFRIQKFFVWIHEWKPCAMKFAQKISINSRHKKTYHRYWNHNIAHTRYDKLYMRYICYLSRAKLTFKLREILRERYYAILSLTHLRIWTAFKMEDSDSRIKLKW